MDAVRRTMTEPHSRVIHSEDSDDVCVSPAKNGEPHCLRCGRKKRWGSRRAHDGRGHLRRDSTESLSGAAWSVRASPPAVTRKHGRARSSGKE